MIGVSDYTNGWPKLSGVREDVEAVSKTLESHHFKVQVVQNPKDFDTLDEAFTSFISKYGRKRENRLLFYFAGHGHTLNNYGEEMIKDQMTTGLFDKDIQEEVLARDKDLTTFQEAYSLVEAYELGKRAKSEL